MAAIRSLTAQQLHFVDVFFSERLREKMAATPSLTAQQLHFVDVFSLKEFINQTG